MVQDCAKVADGGAMASKGVMGVTRATLSLEFGLRECHRVLKDILLMPIPPEILNQQN